MSLIGLLAVANRVFIHMKLMMCPCFTTPDCPLTHSSFYFIQGFTSMAASFFPLPVSPLQPVLASSSFFVRPAANMQTHPHAFRRMCSKTTPFGPQANINSSAWWHVYVWSPTSVNHLFTHAGVRLDWQRNHIRCNSRARLSRQPEPWLRPNQICFLHRERKKKIGTSHRLVSSTTIKEIIHVWLISLCYIYIYPSKTF